MNRAAAFARHRRAPLSEILSVARPRGALHRIAGPRDGLGALDDFAPAAFAATTFLPDAAHAPSFAPTQFVERRRAPRLATAAVPAMAAFSAPMDDPRASAGPRSRVDTDGLAGFGGPMDGSGRGGLVPALERLLDRLTPAPIGTLLALVVIVSLAMAVISALLPLVDLH